MNSMSLREVVRAFDYNLDPCYHGLNSAMSMVFWIEVNNGQMPTEVNSQHRVVHVMVIPGEVEFHGQKGLMHIVLWNDSETSHSYVDIKNWEVIHDRKIYWEVSLDKRVDALFVNMTQTYKTKVPSGHVNHEIKFFVRGFPELITHKGYKMAKDRKTCKVEF